MWRTNVYLCVKEDVAVSPVVTVTSSHPTCHLAAPPPTLLTDKNTRHYYYHTDRKHVEPQRQADSHPVLCFCDSDSSLPFACLDDAMRSSSLSASVAFCFLPVRLLPLKACSPPAALCQSFDYYCI